jgi:hypothetical protein
LYNQWIYNGERVESVEIAERHLLHCYEEVGSAGAEDTKVPELKTRVETRVETRVRTAVKRERESDYE